ncbi:MAG: tetratricopeptide repeat protein [bacterium]
MIFQIKRIFNSIIHNITKGFKILIDKVSMAGFIAICALVLFFFWDFIIMSVHQGIAFYLVERADKEYQNSQYIDAINDYERALQFYPEHYRARYNLGNIYVAYEDYDKAAECYEEALNYKKDFLKARINLGIILVDGLMQIDRAIEQYQIAVSTKSLNPSKIKENQLDRAIAYYNLGLAYKDKSLLLGYDPIASRVQLENAVEAYLNSLKLRDEDYDTYYNLALTYQLLGNFEGAKKYYCKAINMQPFNYEAHYNFAILLSQDGNYFGSMEELEKAGIILDSKGDSYRTYFVYGILNDVSQKAILKEGLGTFLQNSEKNLDYQPDEIKYVDGKVYISDKLDKRILNNMKSCQICKDK